MTHAIKICDISKYYPGVKALDNISFEVKKGTIHAFLGPNGAGKTTTMKIISGLIPSSAGHIEINGLLVAQKLSQIKSMIGLLGETPPLYPNMLVKDFLRFVGRIHGLPSKFLNRQLGEICAKCGLQEVFGRLIGHLSKGYKQRVGLAQALIHNPPILLLDEPTAGLDPAAIVEMRKLINSLKEEHTVLLSSHQLYELGLLCSDLTIINKGTILQTGPFEVIQRNFNSKQVIKAYVKRWSESIGQDIQNSFKCQELEVKKEDEKYHLRFRSSSNEDLRIPISQFLIEKGCGLLSFSEERADLESIFQQVTQDR